MCARVTEPNNIFLFLFHVFSYSEERKLAMDEKPLLVQLNWHKDDREGRFLLRRLDDKTNVSRSIIRIPVYLIISVFNSAYVFFKICSDKMHKRKLTSDE